MAPTRSAPRPRHRAWPLLGAIGGLAVGAVDLALFRATGVSIELEGQDASVAVTLMFGCTFAILGFALGLLVNARQRERAARQHLQEAQAALVQQEKLAALGRVVAGVAHELRNPLGVIRSAAGVLCERSAGDQRLRRAAALVTDEADRLNATITALLGFVRPARLRLEALTVEQILERAREITRARNLEITPRLDPGLPTLNGDPNLLAQLVAGLLDNAADAVGANGRQGRVELRAAVAEGWVQIEVADDGPGLTPEAEAHLFEPFNTTKPDGTGLGLAIAHHIADAHGGRLELVPGVGAARDRAGACLRLSLPAGGQE